MPSANRDMSRDRTPNSLHQHSVSSDSGKPGVPMWDSSDPDRAPPPLPLNPTSRDTSPVRPGAGANVAAAAEALAQRARDNAGPSPYTTNKMEQLERSQERSANKSPQHRRLQSLQNPNLRDFKAALENVRPLDTIASRPATPQSYYNGSPDRSLSRAETPTPVNGKDLLKDTPLLRPSSRPGPRPILGENTPPSATMLAIQNMPRRDSMAESPLADITNSSASTQRKSQNLDSLSSQMQNLTTIATTLQKEMAALSRRSKDNATDLIGLKEATKSRDEDIRKSLRELVSSSKLQDIGRLGPQSLDMSRSTSAMDFSPRFVDSNPFHSPLAAKSVSLPRIPSIDEQDRATSPSPYSVSGASTMAMLEKIVREMVTKEGQERLLSTLSELLNKSGKESKQTAKKVEELVEFIREKQTSKALVRHNGSRRLSIDEASEAAEEALVRPRGRSASKPATPPPSAPALQPQTINIVNDEMRHYLQKLKDSVAQGGGITGEVKSLVRELRGEVLGMGRELGRRMDSLNQGVVSRSDRSMVLADPNGEGLSRIVQEGLAELKEQMEQVIETKRRQSSGSGLSRRSVDNSDVYALVKKSLEEQGIERMRGSAPDAQEVDYEKIVSAVNEAFDAHPFEPEVKVEYLGLDRDEILQCLREGLEAHQIERAGPESGSVSRDEIFTAIKEAFQHFTPPQPMSELSEVKEELTLALKDCLEDFKQQAPRSVDPKQAGDITRDDILDAVREALGVFKKEGAREIDINRNDLFDAVKTGLDNLGYGDEVLQSLHDIVERMRIEFKEYSAANGRDTELVLDATKDGLETLRASIESYVDRVQGDSAKEDIIGTMTVGVDNLRRSIESLAAQSARGDTVALRSELVNYIKSEFEQLHEAIGEQSRAVDGAMTKEQIIGALTAGVAELKSGLDSRDLDGSTEEMLEAMKDEFEQLREAVLNGTASHKDELLETIQENFGSLAFRGVSRDLGSGLNEDVIAMMKEEFEGLKNSLAAPVLHQSPIVDNHEIIDALRDSLENIRMQLSSDRSEAAGDTNGVIREEFERLRESMASSIVSSASTDDRVVVLEAIQETLNELKNSGLRTDEGDNSQALGTVRQELEALRHSISSAVVVGGGAQVDSDGLLAAVHAGFDDVRSQLDQIQHGPERDGSAHEASREILKTLKSGISDLRADIEQVKAASPRKAGDVVLAEEVSGARGMSTGGGDTDSIKKEDLEKLEVALTRLHIKVEAMDRNIQAGQTAPQPAATDFADKETLTKMTTMINELKETVGGLASRSLNQDNGAASKEDTDAIETLLHNTKAKLDDHIIPGLEGLATREHIDTVEAVLRLTSESVDGLSTKFGDTIATKDDVAAVYGLVDQASASIKEFQDFYASTSEDKVLRSDVQAVSEMCKEIQEGLDDLPSSEELPSKSDVDNLHTLVMDFKKIHEGFKQQYETDLEITAQAFDDRKNESTKILEQLGELKDVVTQAKDDLKSRMRRGNEDVRALDEILQGIEDKIDEAPNAISEVQEVMEVINREFQKAHENTADFKSGHDANFDTLSSRHEQLRTAILDELLKKLDERFDAIMHRHDEQELAVHQASELITTRAVAQDELLNSSKATADDLKVTIDTLGIAVTEIVPALKEATDRMGDDSKTVYNKVDDIHSRLDANHVDIMTAHELTRQDVSKSVNSIGALRDDFATFHPQAMDTLTALLAIAGEHYDHTKRSNVTAETSAHDATSIEESIRSGFASLQMPRIEAPPPVGTYDDSEMRTKLDRILASPGYDDAAVRSKLDDILAAGQYNDGGKLDQLLDHATESQKHAANLAKIDEIHQQVLTTAAEVSAFVAFQTQSITEDHQSKQEVARQAAIEVEKYAAEKTDLEVKIRNLAETRGSLAVDVEGLLSERDALNSQKSRLGAELSSIETALKIRREELQTMDARADALERRIVEGVMDHSRALLIAKQPRAPVSMNLKRVTSSTSNATASITTPSLATNAMNLALKKKASTKRATIAPNPSERRIHSLSQINGNSPRGGNIVSSIPRTPASGLTNLKRSQSVRNPATREASWAGHSSIVDYDKENEEQDGLSDLDENEQSSTTSRSLSRTATSMTHRSSSYAGTHTSGSDRRRSYDTVTNASDYSYATGSYFSGTDTDRRTSNGSTVRSVVGTGTAMSIEEGDESGEGEDEEHNDQPAELDEMPQEREETPLEPKNGVPAQLQATEPEPNATAEAGDELQELEPRENEKKLSLVMRDSHGYDSGLGSDLPTAALSSIDGDAYFRNAMENRH